MCVRIEKARKKKRNRMRNRFIFRTTILAILVVAVGFALVTNAKKDHSIYRVGDQAPDFKLKQVNKNNELEEIQLSDFKGQGVMLNFWATYCDPCEYEMPYMQELYADYKEQGIEILAVNLSEAELRIDRFIDKHELTFPVPHDAKGAVSDLYKVGPIPTSYFIDAEGKIVEKIESALQLDQLEEYFEQIKPEQ